ncbi:MAG: hypothetical protein ACYDEA_09405 [Candidatus Dormibacteria bacterium]
MPTSMDMALRGRIGAYRTAATHNTRELTATARAARWAQFEAEVDPDSQLKPAERRRRALAARKAHLARISRLGVLARQKKMCARRAGDLVRLDLTPEQVALLAAIEAAAGIDPEVASPCRVASGRGGR